MILSFITDGAAYTLGRINRDCWYLYTLDEQGVTQPDQTVEISFHINWKKIRKKPVHYNNNNYYT